MEYKEQICPECNTRVLTALKKWDMCIICGHKLKI